jgi:hypothetical protein
MAFVRCERCITGDHADANWRRVRIVSVMASSPWRRAGPRAGCPCVCRSTSTQPVWVSGGTVKAVRGVEELKPPQRAPPVLLPGLLAQMCVQPPALDREPPSARYPCCECPAVPCLGSCSESV